nr:transposase (putative), gypsy type [Tanacetum cinerariifolium]
MSRDTVQLETADMIVDFPEGKVGVYTKFFEFAKFRLPLSQFLFDILGYYQIHSTQLSVIGAAKQEAWEKYPAMLYQALRFPKKLEQPLLLGRREGVPDYYGLAYECSEGWDAGREYVFPKGCDNTEHTSYPNLETTRSTTLLNMDLFNLICAPNPTKVKTGSRPHAAHEVPLLTITANRVIEMEDLAAATDSSGVPSTIERSLLDFANESPSQQSTGPKDQETTAPEVPPPKNVTTTGIAPEADPAERVAATGPPAVKERCKRGHDRVDTNAPPRSSKGAAAAGDPKSENTSFATMVGSPESIYRPEWGITNDCLLDVPGACQDLVDHIGPPGYFLELRHLHNNEFLKQFNDKRIQARENKIKNLETLLEAEADMRKTAENKGAELSTELENMCALISDLQAAFEEFKRYEDNRVEQRCAEMDAHLDALSIDFDEELYLHMLTAIASHRWMIRRGLRLAVMKCGESTELRQAFADVVSAGIANGMSEGLKHGVEHEKAKLDLEAIEAYDPKAEAKYIAALYALKNLKYPLVDQLESLKDAPMDVIMASLHLESDTGDDAPQWIRKLRPSSSQLTIPVYREVYDPMDPWACKEEILLADAIAANISRAEKKKRCRVGLAILLTDAATQTDTSDEASPRFLRLSSLPVIRG